jgi:hypothetical protein
VRVSGGLLAGEAVQLARLGRGQELVVDDVMIGDAPPQPPKDIVAVGADLGRPGRFRIAGVEPERGQRVARASASARPAAFSAGSNAPARASASMIAGS